MRVNGACVGMNRSRTHDLLSVRAQFNAMVGLFQLRYEVNVRIFAQVKVKTTSTRTHTRRVGKIQIEVDAQLLEGFEALALLIDVQDNNSLRNAKTHIEIILDTPLNRDPIAKTLCHDPTFDDRSFANERHEQTFRKR